MPLSFAMLFWGSVLAACAAALVLTLVAKVLFALKAHNTLPFFGVLNALLAGSMILFSPRGWNPVTIMQLCVGVLFFAVGVAIPEMRDRK